MRYAFNQIPTPSVNSPRFTFSDFNPYTFPLFPATQGDRHPQLTAFAGHLRYHGAEETDLEQQLNEADRRFSCPRKSPGEIRKLAHYAAEHWIPGKLPTSPSNFDIPSRGLAWLREHCFDPRFSRVRGCVDFAVLYICLLFSKKAGSVDFHASCREVALAASITPITASRSLRRLCNAGLLVRIGHRKMDEAQQYSLGSILCSHPHKHPWVEISSAMFGVSRAAAKLQILCGDAWLNSSATELNTWTLGDLVALRVIGSRYYAAKRVLVRNKLDSLGKAEVKESWVKMRMRIVFEQREWREIAQDARAAKRRTRGQKGHLVMRGKDNIAC